MNDIKNIPDTMSGLTFEQVKEYTEKGLTNKQNNDNEKSNSQIIKENTFTYFNLIFLVLTILIILTGSFKNLTFIPVVLINILIGIIQEIKAKNILSKLQMMNEPQTTVIRENVRQDIDSKNLVLHDLVVYSTGNQITADAVVEKGEIKVNESLLTGETDEILKRKGDSLLSGSFVISGECYAKVERIGDDCYIAKLSKEAKENNKQEESEMIKSLNQLLKVIGIIIIPIGLLLFYQGYFLNHNSFRETIITMVAAIVGMIPEGLYLLTTISLALSATKLAKQQILIHDMKSIETLSRVDVLCVDKTGTITNNEMEVKEIINISNETLQDLDEIISDFVSVMKPDNETMKAMKKYFKKSSDQKAISKLDFSSKYKYSSATFSKGTFMFGAPDILLKDRYTSYKEIIDKYANQGCRVILFGKYNHPLHENEEITDPVEPWCFIVFSNTVRKNAKETFEYFEKQDVNIKVISGDNPITVSRIAKEAGIKNYDECINAATLTTDKEIADAVNKYTVFGRVTPEQKKSIILSLQQQGHTVAMTGDGINDILALKAANCSIAMASGSEATAHAAQLVLLDSDFSHMPSVVLEGRRVVNNIQRSASLFLVKNIFSIIMSIITIIFAVSYPLQPSNISLISMFTIGIPGYFLALEINDQRIKGKFINSVIIKALPAALTNVFIVSVLIVFREVFNLSPTDVSTAATLLLGVVGFMILYDICKPLNDYRKFIISLNITGLIICSIFFNDLFALEKMSKICIVAFITLSLAADSFYRYTSKFIKIIRKDI